MLPVVLHHGVMGFSNLLNGPLRMSYFSGIDRAIADRGHPLIVSHVHPTAGIETRARQLKETILRQLEIQGHSKARVLVIGHSMGGLDARYMIARLGMEEHVAALLTITTPHRGSPYADWCVRHLGQRLGGFQLMNVLGWDVQAASDLTTKSCRRFNQEIRDSPNVRYFSVSASRPWHRVPPFALHAFKVVYDAEGENDCLVSVKSSTWGTHLGVWPADHFHTVNKRFVLEIKQPTGDITRYYIRALAKVLRAIR